MVIKPILNEYLHRVRKWTNLIMKFFKFLYLTIAFKVSAKSVLFWDWLFSKVIDRNSRYYRDKDLIGFLLLDARSHNNHENVCKLYLTFYDSVDFSKKAKEQVYLSASKIKDHDVLEALLM